MTATGVRAREGRTIAVDPKVISYGTHVLINGHEYVAEDCGGAIKGNDIDIYLEDHDRVYESGVDWYDVYILRN
jgi:3D (Asp-Asp-Asp) domain-containing protein